MYKVSKPYILHEYYYGIRIYMAMQAKAFNGNRQYCICAHTCSYWVYSMHMHIYVALIHFTVMIQSLYRQQGFPMKTKSKMVHDYNKHMLGVDKLD